MFAHGIHIGGWVLLAVVAVAVFVGMVLEAKARAKLADVSDEPWEPMEPWESTEPWVD